MNKKINFIDNEEQIKEAEIIIGFQANKKKYLLYSTEELKKDLDKKEQLETNSKVFIAEMVDNEETINLKGLYDEEYKLIASKVMNVIASFIDSNLETYQILEKVDIDNFSVIDVIDDIGIQVIKEDRYFEPRKIQAPLYYLNGISSVYNKTVEILPDVEELSVEEASEILEESKEDKISGVIDFQLELEKIVDNNKNRKTEDSKVIEEIIKTALNKIDEIQTNNLKDIDSIQNISLKNAVKLQEIVDQFSSEIQFVKDKANKLVKEYKNKRKDLILALEKIVQLEKVVETRDDSLAKLQNNLSNETKEKNLKDRKIEELEKQIKELTHKIDEQNGKENNQVDTLNNTILEQQKIIDIFKSDTSKDEMDKKITKFQYEIVTLREELDKKNIEFTNLKKELENVALEKDSYEQSSKSLTQLIASKNLEARELYDRIKELESYNEEQDPSKKYIKAA